MERFPGRGHDRRAVGDLRQVLRVVDAAGRVIERKVSSHPVEPSPVDAGRPGIGRGQDPHDALHGRVVDPDAGDLADDPRLVDV